PHGAVHRRHPDGRARAGGRSLGNLGEARERGRPALRRQPVPQGDPALRAGRESPVPAHSRRPAQGPAPAFYATLPAQALSRPDDRQSRMGIREGARRRHRRRLQPVRGQASQGRRLQAARREPGRRAEIFRLEVHLLAGAAARHSAGRRDSGRWDSGRRDSGRRDSVGWDSVRWDSVRRARAVAVAEPQGNVPSSGWSQVNRGEAMFVRICGAAALLLVIPFSAHAAITCADVRRAIDKDLAGVVTCFVSNDLTTNNTAIDQKTTPDNNSLGLAPGAFTPTTDRGVISPDAPNRTPIMKAVPGLQINARIASDPTGQARFLLRLPNDWNGRLVVAGASGTRSEFNGDFAWSDYVVQKG